MHKTNERGQFVENIKFSGTVEGGFCWDELARERMRDPRALEPYGYKVYSQNDEDGIIHEIFQRIGTASKIFIEFGVQDGLESNCHLLLFYGWRGLWIEGSAEYCSMINTKFRPVIESRQLQIMNAFVTKSNINELLTGYTGGGNEEIDLLSIDIDGNDIYIWEAINVVNPRVVIIEYNGKFPPDLEWRQAYNPSHIWHEDDWHGASLKAFEKLGRQKGYRLVGTNLRGTNAFFVRNDLAGELFYDPAVSEMLYNPLRLGLQFKASHSSKYCLAVQKDYLGILNYQFYELMRGFHEEEVISGVRRAWTAASESVMRLLVASDVEYIEIPYSLPGEAVSGYNGCQVVISVNGNEKLRQDIDDAGLFRIAVDWASAENSVLELHIKLPFTWRPCDLLGSPDLRNLGININISDIKMI